jgi:glycosyltransferase involved in cell wall biosynthesis
MKVRLVCYENVGEWIIGKFASRLNEELQALGINSEISKFPDPHADVNHHLIYLGYDPLTSSPMDTLMVTHIDTVYKTRLLRGQLQNADMGICMSRHTMEKLAAAGFPRHKLCHVHPAHDGAIRPRPLLIGITTRVYADGRKREYFLEKLCRGISPDDFSFWIMGQGWEAAVAGIQTLGFSVDYQAEFDGRLYQRTMPALDFFLYFGLDEGSMGFLDALAAGVKTIATPVGYQADLSARITYKVRTFSDLENAFSAIARERKTSAAAVAFWTWENYARKHLLIWEYLLGGRHRDALERSRALFPDGLATLNDERPLLPQRLFRRMFFFTAVAGNSLKRRWRRISGKGPGERR